MSIFLIIILLFFTLIILIKWRNKINNDRKIIQYYIDNEILIEYPYYKKLSPAGKAKFIKRLDNFINRNEFIGLLELEVTEEMKILISASAAQLTFGLKDYRIENYHKVFIYPKDFYYKVTRQIHKGHTALQAFFSLSWKHFMENYNHPEKRKNLALHELTHALEFNLLHGRYSDSKFADYYDSWVEAEENEIEKIQDGEPSFFSQYSGKNIHEFFATAVEFFFETPEKFKKEASELYLQLCILLNQDPCNIEKDYALQSNINNLVDFRKSYQQRSWHWSATVLLVGAIIGTITLFIMIPKTLISFNKVVLYISLISLTASVIQYRYFVNNFWFGYFFYSIYNVLGIGLTFFALLLALNYTIPIYETEVNNYQIVEYYPKTYNGNSIKVKICCPDDHELELLSVDIFALTNLKSSMVRLETRKGLFGFKVILSKNIIRRSKKKYFSAIGQ